ncbi:hypothetical protein GH714_010748 [Hevea brasiliensis]|uniref:B-like cyclin n=1 Tax=Hevea brasiliensis TaxID=3981 RepID=A0A6A6LN86_HEVBR|nr:hypothetical protein GH714_010748 [Hevea brasiliensis]
MVAAKGKVQMGINRATEDSRCHRTDKVVSNFKVYTDNEKAKVDVGGISIRESIAPARTSVPVNKGALSNATNDSKGGSKFAKNIKGKSVSSVNQDFNVRRKALADVSNVQSSFSRNVTCDGSKTMITGCSRSRTVNMSSRKCSMGRMNIGQRVTNFHATREGVKDLSALSDDQRNTKNPGCESVVIVNNSRSARNSLMSMRKSLPVLMTVNQTDTSKIKNNDEGLGKAKRNSGFSGKVKARKDVVPKVSICRSHLQKNKVSDGFIRTDQTNVKAHGGSRKFIKPAIKAAISVPNAHRTLRSKGTSAMKKSISIAAVLPNRKDESVTSSLLDNIPVVVSHEATEEPSFERISKSTANKPDAIVQRKSDRRRSYTTSLMARSKLLVEHGEVIEQEKVPCIDDNCNQLEVAEYVHDIYQFYWVSEAQNLSLANYMSILTEITPQMRGILINWLIEVHFKFELMQETLYLMVILLDQYLSQVQIKKNQMQLVGLTALLLASKYEDFWHPRIKDLLSISAQSYTRDEMLAMEKLILKKLKFRLNTPTPYVFMLRFLKAAQTDLESQLGHLSFYLIELSLVEYEALKFKPSMLCASAIYVARCTLQDPAWTPLLAKHTRYEVSQIRNCAEMILGFQKAARTSHLKVTYEKYMRPDLSSVATLKPLDKLPL